MNVKNGDDMNIKAEIWKKETADAEGYEMYACGESINADRLCSARRKKRNDVVSLVMMNKDIIYFIVKGLFSQRKCCGLTFVLYVNRAQVFSPRWATKCIDPKGGSRIFPVGVSQSMGGVGAPLDPPMGHTCILQPGFK